MIFEYSNDYFMKKESCPCRFHSILTATIREDKVEDKCCCSIILSTTLSQERTSSSRLQLEKERKKAYLLYTFCISLFFVTSKSYCLFSIFVKASQVLYFVIFLYLVVVILDL